MRRRVMVVFGWLVAVAVATAVGLTGVSLLADGLTSASVTPLSRDAVANALASSTVASTSPGPAPSRTAPAGTAPHASTTAQPTSPSTRSPGPRSSVSTAPPTSASPSGPSRTRSFGSPAGSVIARCTGASAYLVSWSPAQGWSVDEHVRGPAKATLVRFDGSGDTDEEELTITVTCRSGEPVAAMVTTDD